VALEMSASEGQQGLSDLVGKALSGEKKSPVPLRPTPERVVIPEKRLYYDELREVLYVIRDHAAQGVFSVNNFDTGHIGPYVDIAASCRNAMVKILSNCTRDDVHCTIKYCTKGRGKGGRRAQVWTFARSDEHQGRAMHLGPDMKIAVRKNSAFSSIVGCKDSKGNTWESRPHQCFSCNDLTAVTNYADSKRNWRTYYTTVVAFPLRYRRAGQGPPAESIIGFLTFDSLIKGVFGEIPSRFAYMGQPDEYLADFRKTDVYHVGYAIADAVTLATILAGQPVGEGDAIQIEGDD